MQSRAHVEKHWILYCLKRSKRNFTFRAFVGTKSPFLEIQPRAVKNPKLECNLGRPTWVIICLLCLGGGDRRCSRWSYLGSRRSDWWWRLCFSFRCKLILCLIWKSRQRTGYWQCYSDDYISNEHYIGDDLYWQWSLMIILMIIIMLIGDIGHNIII